jgi:hypothetical protein
LTITIRRSTATIFIALVGILGGLAIGQVTQATSSNSAATASASSEQTLSEINTRLREIHRVIGKSSGVYNILGQIKEINRKTR